MNDSKNFDKLFDLLRRKVENEEIDKVLGDDLIRDILKLEGYALNNEENYNEDDLTLIGKSIRNFLEIFLMYLIPEKGKFKSVHFSEGKYDNVSNHDRIDFLGKNGLERVIKDSLFRIKFGANPKMHYGNNNVIQEKFGKISLINILYEMWFIFYWYFDLKLENTFRSKRYYIDGIKEEKANLKILQTFFHQPYRSVVINDEKIINILFDDSVEFFIPIYQRSYSWTEDEINDLFYDLNRRMIDEKEHFFGSVTFIQGKITKKGNKKITEIKIVDGQQRFTTLTLLLKAIYECYYRRYKKDQTKIDAFLSNFVNQKDVPIKRFDEDGSIKAFEFIWSRNLDEKGDSDFQDWNNNIAKVYILIMDKIRSYSIDELDNLYRAVEFLIVGINWIKDFNEFELFESINSKGKELTNFDIFKNYLMSLLEDELEDKYAKDIALIFNSSIKYKLDWLKKDQEKITDKFLEKFILYIGKNAKVNKKRLFSQFKDAYQEYLKEVFNKEGEITLKEYEEIIFDFAKFFHAVILTNSGDQEIWNKMFDFRKFYKNFYGLLDSPTYASFLIPYLIDSNNFEFSEMGTIIKAKKPKEFIKIIDLLVSWRVRGEVVFINDNITIRLGDLLSELNRQIKIDKNNSFYEILKKLINSQYGILILPSIEIFSNSLNNNLIKNASIIKIIMAKIVNENIPDFDNLKIFDYNIFPITNKDSKKRDSDWNRLTKEISADEDQIFSMIGNYFYHTKSGNLKSAKEKSIKFLVKNISDDNFTTNISDKYEIDTVKNLDNGMLNLKDFIKNRTKQIAEKAKELFKIEE